MVLRYKGFVNMKLEVLKSNLFEVAFIALLVRFIVSGTSMSDALVLLGLIASIVYVKHFLTKHKTEKSDETTLRLEEMERVVSSLAIKVGLSKK